MKKVECCECGKMVEVPDELDPEQTGVFCSQRCIEAESRRVYQQEMQRGLDERHTEEYKSEDKKKMGKK